MIDWTSLGDEAVDVLRRYLMGYSPFVLDDDDIRRVHGNDERVSIDNIVAGVRSYTEMLLAVAGV
jgi:acetylornithine deacetylase/succinyl-diaminopimelate desuccinylase-like protein